MIKYFYNLCRLQVYTLDEVGPQQALGIFTTHL